MVPEDETQSEHMDAILCTMALLCIEVGFDEVSSVFFFIDLTLLHKIYQFCCLAEVFSLIS